MRSRSPHSTSAPGESDASGRRWRTGPDKGRGQTTLDFAIGVSVFLIGVVFVLSFVPGMLQPFEESGSEHNVVADRVASSLVEGTLADPDEPFLLDKDCTRWFFGADDGYSEPSGCNFDADPIPKRLGVQGYPAGTGPNVNVTVIGDFDSGDELELLCVDTAAGYEITGKESCNPEGDDFLFAVGSEPPTGSGSVATARRVASIDGETVVVIVRVW